MVDLLEEIVPELKRVNDMIEGRIELPTVQEVEGLENDCAD